MNMEGKTPKEIVDHAYNLTLEKSLMYKKVGGHIYVDSFLEAIKVWRNITLTQEDLITMGYELYESPLGRLAMKRSPLVKEPYNQTTAGS